MDRVSLHYKGTGGSRAVRILQRAEGAEWRMEEPSTALSEYSVANGPGGSVRINKIDLGSGATKHT